MDLTNNFSLISTENKTEEDVATEGRIIQQMLDIVQQRNHLVSLLENDRQRCLSTPVQPPWSLSSVSVLVGVVLLVLLVVWLGLWKEIRDHGFVHIVDCGAANDVHTRNGVSNDMVPVQSLDGGYFGSSNNIFTGDFANNDWQSVLSTPNSDGSSDGVATALSVPQPAQFQPISLQVVRYVSQLEYGRLAGEVWQRLLDLQRYLMELWPGWTEYGGH